MYVSLLVKKTIRDSRRIIVLQSSSMMLIEASAGSSLILESATEREMMESNVSLCSTKTSLMIRMGTTIV